MTVIGDSRGHGDAAVMDVVRGHGRPQYGSSWTASLILPVSSDRPVGERREDDSTQNLFRFAFLTL